MSTFSTVPSNIKSLLLPFCLNPNSALYTNEFKNTTGVDPLYFTFRYNDKAQGSGKGILNFCPTTYLKYFNEDISYRLIYEPLDPEGINSTSLTYSSMLNSIPAVMIREYIPDTTLDLLINLFFDIAKGIKELFTSNNGIKMGEDSKKENKTEADKENMNNFTGMFNKLNNVLKFVMDYIIGKGEKNIVTELTKVGKVAKLLGLYSYTSKVRILEDIGKETRVRLQYTDKKWFGSNEVGPWVNKPTKKSSIPEGLRNRVVTPLSGGASPWSAAIDIPYMLYYQLLSCTTTGIYEIPCIKADNMLYSSDGHPGWDTEGAGFRFLPQSLTSIPGIGSVIGAMFGNIGISWTPWWNATKGNATPEKDVVLTFDLFNDTSDAALINFIFINTLIPNNKWILYGLFLHSSHIYDVRIEGYNRLFACSGNFDVKYKGVLRDPPECWFKYNTVLHKYVTASISNKEEFLTRCYENKLIKIPDVYEVTMTFKSLLPSNFNQYLYTYIANDNVLTTYKDYIFDESKIVPGLKSVVSGIISGAKSAWNKK